MKKLNIDLELLLELSLHETRGEGECYINLSDGEFAYIPQNIIEALKDKSIYSTLESWEREIALVAEDVIMNYSDNYLYVPLIKDEILLSAMKEYVESLPDDTQTLINLKVDWDNAFLSFNKVLLDKGILDQYYDFKERFLKDYLRDWLNTENIEVI